MSSSFWFWTHFFFVTVSHFFLVVLAISLAVNFYKSNLSILDRLRRIAIIYFLAVLGTNHITNPQSLCILTTLENEARTREGKEHVGIFMPRYYKKITEVF